MINFNDFSLKEAHLVSGFVVVVDLLRTLTTSAYVFNRGAKKLLLFAVLLMLLI